MASKFTQTTGTRKGQQYTVVKKGGKTYRKYGKDVIAVGGKSTPAAPSGPSQADILRLGSEVANIKAATKPKTWASFVNDSHAKGFTVGGALSGAPDSLKERTQGSLRDTATKTISGAYAPVYKDLDSQEARVKAWDVKRQKDNESYNAWLTSQNATLATQAAAQSATLAQQNAAIVQAASSASAATQAAAGQNYITADTAGHAQANQELVNAAGQHAMAPLNIAAAVQPVRDASQLATTAARDTQRQADTNKALNGVFDSRTKAQISQASDTVGEFTRLQSQNVSNADSTRNYNAAVQKLDLQGQTLDLNALKAKQNYRLGKGKLGVAKTNAKTSAKNADTTSKSLSERIRHNQETEAGAATTRGDIATYRKEMLRLKGLGLATDKVGGKLTASQQHLSSTGIQQVDSAKDELLRYFKQKPGGNGRAHLANLKISATVIDVANDLRKHHGKLSANGIKKAKALGILDPEHYYGKA